MTSYRLLCPGPVNVRHEVAQALTEAEICHREEEFSSLLQQIRQNVLLVAGLRQPERYTSVVITGSGSSANEAVLSSAVRADERVLVIASGEFGQRLGHISSIYNPQTRVLRHEWGTDIDLEEVERAIRDFEPHLVAMVHHETSTGLLNPIHEVGELCQRHHARFYVDAVSSFSADRIDIEGCNITFLGTSSGKALGTYPGLSVVIGLRSAFEEIAHFPVRNYYLHLDRYFRFAEDHSQTPMTPAVPLFLALNRALELVVEEGIASRLQHHESLAQLVRAGLKARGLRMLREDTRLSNAVSSVFLPNGVAFEALRQGLRERG
ncbi:MAG: aminotransferase class V-fold PLP-dependent enzyme, partial [Myxococcota bacterium]|nr:aminotransferase class V-fold PLP-dependent enzyme [Myxococcota bacterium]